MNRYLLFLLPKLLLFTRIFDSLNEQYFVPYVGESHFGSITYIVLNQCIVYNVHFTLYIVKV